MWHDQDQHAFIQGCPAQDVVLAQRPVLVQATFEMHQVTALPETHLLRKPGELIQVRRIVGDAPNPGLRQVVKFHVCARSDFRATALFSTVRVSV